MIIIKTVADMQAQARAWRQNGERIGFVPTMGYLHEGHLSLVRLAKNDCGKVVVSVFVNPTQFGPDEDLDRYPRDFEGDEQKCREEGVAAVFYPDATELYPSDFSTWVVEEALSAPLCGRSRPVHFRGVTTIVAKLFNAVLPDVAMFGQKDAQQAFVIKRMVRDLNFPVDIVVGPIVREPDGLAMSSRNAYLTDDERRRALSIHRGIEAARRSYEHGERTAKVLRKRVLDQLQAAHADVDYVEIVSRQTLQPLDTVNEPALLAVAAIFGQSRLIDNCFL